MASLSLSLASAENLCRGGNYRPRRFSTPYLWYYSLWIFQDAAFDWKNQCHDRPLPYRARVYVADGDVEGATESAWMGSTGTYHPGAGSSP